MVAVSDTIEVLTKVLTKRIEKNTKNFGRLLLLLIVVVVVVIVVW